MLAPRPVKEVNHGSERLTRLLGHDLKGSLHSIIVATFQFAQKVILRIIVFKDDLLNLLV